MSRQYIVYTCKENAMPQTKTKQAKPGKAEPHPLLIRQRELQAVVDLEHVTDTLCLSLLRRVRLAAPVEPGALQIRPATGGTAPIESYEDSMESYQGCGLFIMPVSE